ncbi:MAG: FAD-dependent oxidoreductase, partial [Planctomycetes bacterium]|nr:FAD-dependent oxidoreductase [Planctomycetota bacterium]
MSIRLSNIRTGIEEPEAALVSRAAQALDVRVDDIERWRILRKSLDVRDKSRISYVYSLEIELPERESQIVARVQRRSGGVEAELYREPS